MSSRLGATKIGVRNPRTGDVDYWFVPPSLEELKDLSATLRAGQGPWESVGVEGRVAALAEWSEAIAEHRAQIVSALVGDTGRRIESEMEVDAILGSLARWSRLAPELLSDEGPRPSSIPIVSVAQQTRPYSLVGVISPWNFPLLLSLIDAIPALLAGCAVIVKPSEVAPRFIDSITETSEGVPGLGSVLGFIAGAGETGAQLIDEVDAICFTGSVPTGRIVAAQAAGRFIPAFLELGGKDPAIVLASADLDRASSAILWGSTANAGQSCQSIERVYVDSSVYDEFADRLVEKANELRLAEPTPEDGQIGPIIAADQIEVIRRHIEDAISQGARVRCGGSLEVIDGGTYCPPTVLTGVDHNMLVMTEETFGPIMPLMPFGDADEAVALSNDTVYGLSGSVFAGSSDEALAVASRMNAGGISVNDAALTALVHDGEKNSFNLSGLGGSRMGPAALRRFGRRQAFLINETAAPDPWWYPQLKK